MRKKDGFYSIPYSKSPEVKIKIRKTQSFFDFDSINFQSKKKKNKEIELVAGNLFWRINIEFTKRVNGRRFVQSNFTMFTIPT